ncbi:hypothetical protein BC939DRAFT_450099 [Gamsiella multidivaricata]|uniref:uncharacterized protein n=1 Tax=Gamsiella multidivaricata TaxID=101098 RepID=UPI00221F97C6|nr:uncharacterized protein BC939DRAFT_450099 [Gamsiella multidivaricata]KAI7824342.1 hypothetical protein BC939DRAFT_450099 [Gamsiella multidivaricata]
MLATKVFQPIFLVVAALFLFNTIEAAPKKTKECIQCFAPPMCPPCSCGYECVIIPPSCHDCGEGFCRKL